MGSLVDLCVNLICFASLIILECILYSFCTRFPAKEFPERAGGFLPSSHSYEPITGSWARGGDAMMRHRWQDEARPGRGRGRDEGQRDKLALMFLGFPPPLRLHVSEKKVCDDDTGQRSPRKTCVRLRVGKSQTRHHLLFSIRCTRWKLMSFTVRGKETARSECLSNAADIALAGRKVRGVKRFFMLSVAYSKKLCFCYDLSSVIFLVVKECMIYGAAKSRLHF